MDHYVVNSFDIYFQKRGGGGVSGPSSKLAVKIVFHFKND
jgi:hypothetical protein